MLHTIVFSICNVFTFLSMVASTNARAELSNQCWFLDVLKIFLMAYVVNLFKA